MASDTRKAEGKKGDSASHQKIEKKGDEKKMFDVIVYGKVIAKASTEVESEIYKLDFEGLKPKAIADILHIPIHTVKRYTEGYATR